MHFGNSVLFLAAAQAASANPAAIVQEKIVAGARLCMAGNVDGMLADYAEDIVLSYPGIPDHGLAAIRQGYQGLCRTAGEGTLESTTPTFEELFAAGDIVIARLTWSTHLRGMKPGEVRKLRDFQVWQNRGGKWEFVRGVHYPVREQN